MLRLPVKPRLPQVGLTKEILKIREREEAEATSEARFTRRSVDQGGVENEGREKRQRLPVLSRYKK